MYVEYLEAHGFRVAEAADGVEAVARTLELLPSVVVMDLSLPLMDGWEATRRLKADPRSMHIRVIALTGHADAVHAQRSREAGCDDFVAKPCMPEQLLAKVREHVAHLASTTSDGTKVATGRFPKKQSSRTKK